MKKIIRLTESDLARIVRRVLNEGRSEDQIYASFKERTMLELMAFVGPKGVKFVRGSNVNQTTFFTYNCTTGEMKKEPSMNKIYAPQDMVDIKEYCAFAK